MLADAANGSSSSSASGSAATGPKGASEPLLARGSEQGEASRAGPSLPSDDNTANGNITTEIRSWRRHRDNSVPKKDDSAMPQSKITKSVRRWYNSRLLETRGEEDDEEQVKSGGEQAVPTQESTMRSIEASHREVRDAILAAQALVATSIAILPPSNPGSAAAGPDGERMAESHPPAAPAAPEGAR